MQENRVAKSGECINEVKGRKGGGGGCRRAGWHGCDSEKDTTHIQILFTYKLTYILFNN